MFLTIYGVEKSQCDRSNYHITPCLPQKTACMDGLYSVCFSSLAVITLVLSHESII